MILDTEIDRLLVLVTVATLLIVIAWCGWFEGRRK